MTVLASFEVNKRFGGLLRRARERQGISQLQLSRRSALGRTTIANIELGAQSATLHQVVLLAASLGVDPRSLVPDMSEVIKSDPDNDRMMQHRDKILRGR